MGLFKLIAGLLRELLKFLNTQEEKKADNKAEKENQNAQVERNKIEKDPTDWLNTHFGSPSDGVPETPEDRAGSTTSTNKTDS